MATNTNSSETIPKSIRIWPGIILGILLWIVRFGVPYISPGIIGYCIFGGIILGLGILVWWAFFSRAPGFDRWFAIVLMVATIGITSTINDRSIATAMMGMMFFFYAIPIMCIVFVIWVFLTRNLQLKARRLSMIITIILTGTFWVCLRTNGMDGQSHQFFALRWSKTSEDRILSTNEKLAVVAFDSSEISRAAEWPGFRGPGRDAVVHNLVISTDWTQSSPVELWRRQVGPACSSFAVMGELIYTQEQRGDLEMVSCYDLKTGNPVWHHSDKTRFWDSHAGAGPRSTPYVSNGKVYAAGATGIVNVLNAFNGNLIWTCDAAKDANVKLPGWGYAGSPVVVDSVVLIAIAGKLLAYDISTGKKLWSGTDGGECYSSPQLMIIDGVKQVLFMNKEAVTSYDPSNGNILWKLSNPAGSPIVQPAQVSGGDLLINIGDVTTPLRQMWYVTVKNTPGKWTIAERWKTDQLRPYFNDFVIHKGNVYGFEGPDIVCIDLDKGNRKWRGGRFGGQMLLIDDQDLILVLSEKGEIALVKATPEKYGLLARFQAIKGKTWNHPVIAGDILLVRNSEEMAAFRLPKTNHN